jgi:hypothetical protein
MSANSALAKRAFRCILGVRKGALRQSENVNSKNIWDIKSGVSNQSDVVRKLEEYNIHSLHRRFFNSANGEEKHPTFFL